MTVPIIIIITIFGLILTLLALSLWFSNGGRLWALVWGAIAVVLFVQAWREAQPEQRAVRAAEEKAHQEAEAAKLQPRVVREADGCKVYAFSDGDRWHYFTRCPNSTTSHDAPYKVCVGKSCRVEIETAVTKEGA